MKKIAMIGVGKLGQDCAEVMHDSGYDVVGYDIEPKNPKFVMKDSIQDAITDRDIIFIAAPTPHDPVYGGETPTSHLPNKDFDYSIVKKILGEVNKYVNKNQLVVLISTVLPGTIRTQLYKFITNARFIYNPYLIAMGTIKWDMVNPEMIIIGTEDGSITGDAEELIDFYKTFMQNDPRYEVGTWDEAESIKIFYNTFISTKLALVNMIQDVAETNKNINVDIVTNALKNSTYRIMGPAYMTAGLGDAGACHPRDNIALRYLAERLNLGYDLFDSIMSAREVQAERMALRCLKNGKNVTIIGKAYKPGVHYTNGSASMLIGYYIEKHGGNLNYYDVNTGDNDLRQNWTDVYLIGYWEPWVERINFTDPGCVVIDPWRKIKTTQHTGEIIHYGDTRIKHRYNVPENTIVTMRKQLFEIFPYMDEYDKQIHLIDATINFETTFVLRPTEDLVNEIKIAKNNGKNKFLFFACTEGFMPHVLSKIHRIANILEDYIEDKDFIFLTTVPDGDNIYKKYKKEHITNKNITILNCNFFYYITTTYAKEFEYIGDYEVKHKSKLFTCFNKLNREVRMRLLNKMFEYNLVDNAYYSFEGDEFFIENIDNLSDEFYNFIKINKDKLPLKLNITPNRSNPVNIKSDDIIYYKNSYFSVITETLFYNKNYQNQHHKPFVENSMFLTEKVYRCFAMRHPFILFARPHALKHLKKQGFKTFSPHIDESYDDIENDEERFETIVKEINRLCNFDGNKWLYWQNSIKEIIKHNHNIFYNSKNFVFSENYLSLFDTSENIVNIPDETCLSILDTTQPVLSKNIYETEDEPIIFHQNKNDEPLDWTNKQITFSNGIILNFPNHLDGGGFEIKEEIFNIIKTNGKTLYNKTLEWCSGIGPFGFELLDKNLTNHVVFSDVYDIATEYCIKNAKENNLENKITVYTTDSILNIPQNEKFDLIVANPPHCNSVECIEKNSNYYNTIRIIVDENYNAHKDFFANISNYLENDADLFITGVNNNDFIIQWAYAGKLKFIKAYESSIISHTSIYHFKPITGV